MSGAKSSQGSMASTYGLDLPCSGQCRGQAKVVRRMIGRHWLSAWAQPPPALTGAVKSVAPMSMSAMLAECIHKRMLYTVDFRRSLACQGGMHCFMEHDWTSKRAYSRSHSRRAFSLMAFQSGHGGCRVCQPNTAFGVTCTDILPSHA